MKPMIFNYAEHVALQAELERVTTERDAMLVDLKRAADDNGGCYGCKHLDPDTDRCSSEEYRMTCNTETNNCWQWRGTDEEGKQHD